MDSAADKVKKYRDEFTSETEKLVKKSFPAKVLLLIEFLKEKFNVTDFKKIYHDVNIPVVQPLVLANEPNSKKRKIEDEDSVQKNSFQNGPLKVIPLNELIVGLIENLKPEIRDLMENCNIVKTWIQLLIPRIEDGNNFGVSIQAIVNEGEARVNYRLLELQSRHQAEKEDILGEVTRIEAEAASFLDQISRYFITRGKVVSKIVKYPHVMDYRRTVIELDEKEYISLKLCCCELKNHYLCLHDSIIKNFEKIIKPRTSNAVSLY